MSSSLKITREIGDRYGEGNSLWCQAICHGKMNNLDNSIKNAEEALKILEQIKFPRSTMRELLVEWRGK